MFQDKIRENKILSCSCANCLFVSWQPLEILRGKNV
jgi:hypothetical protein